MTTCPCCYAARHYPGTDDARQHCPSCLYCGARMIRTVLKLPTPPADKTARARENLAVWVAHGHDEAELRELVKSAALPVAPEKK
jgi:hypothetical protein